MKHTGEYPIIGVNTFLSSKGSPTLIPQEVIRSSNDEKLFQIKSIELLKEFHSQDGAKMLERLQKVAIKNENVFEELMETVKYCSLGQITNALFEVGGEYRRNM